MNDLTKTHPVVLRQDVIWGDMDSYQHVNNRVYFRYFEDARMAYFERAGMMQYKDQTQVGPILASTRCDFRAPLTYPDQIQVAASVHDILDKRFTMRYAVYSSVLDKIAAEGEGLIVYYDYANARSCNIPEQIIAAVNGLQSGYDD